MIRETLLCIARLAALLPILAFLWLACRIDRWKTERNERKN